MRTRIDYTWQSLKFFNSTSVLRALIERIGDTLMTISSLNIDL